LQYLQNQNINRLIIIGMQTHMCLEAAVRAGHDYGFECVVIADACATRDLKYGDQLVKAADVHASTLATLAGANYAKVIQLEQFISEPETFLYKTF
jgi:nicotinamidase-related amidase